MPKSTPAQVLCSSQGYHQGQCHVRHIDLPNDPRLSKLPNVWPDIRGLNQLQVDRRTWINGDGIEKALNAYRRNLPVETQEKIHIADTSIEGMFDEDEDRYHQIRTTNYSRFFNRFRETEYTLWPLNYNGIHWELCVIRKENKTAEKTGWNRVTQVAILDGWKEDGARARERLLESRVRAYLEGAGFTFAPGCGRVVWVPWQLDDFSCGFRLFWAGRRMMNRILERTGKGYDEVIWKPMSGWFNYDFVRWEMIGLNAYEAIREMDYNARIAIELVASIQGPSGDRAAGPIMRPPDDICNGTVATPENEITKRKRGGEDDGDQPAQKRTAVVPAPNRFRVAASWSIREGDYDPGDEEDSTEDEDGPVWPPPRRTGGRAGVPPPVTQPDPQAITQPAAQPAAQPVTQTAIPPLEPQSAAPPILQTANLTISKSDEQHEQILHGIATKAAKVPSLFGGNRTFIQKRG